MSRSTSLPPKVLSIAGSDSGGGAGIQADLKAFARCGVHGMTAITAVTAQNTVAVTGVYPLPPEAIVEQVRAVVEDIGVDAVKIGMLGTAETIAAVDRALDLVGDAPIVLDPVMVAESGARLLDEDAEEVLRTRLLRRVAVVTPNLPEARVLAGAQETRGAPGRAPTRPARPRPSSSLGRSWRAARARLWSRAVTGRPRRTSSSTATGSSRSPVNAIPAAPGTGRAAPTRRRWRRTSPSASTRSRRREGPSR